MTLHLVHHRTEAPAVDAMLAGVIAAELGATLLVLDTGGGGLGAFEARQHVLASGALAANGLFWSEWASGRPVPAPLPPAVIARRSEPALLVPVNPEVAAQAEMAARLRLHAAAAGRALREITVEDSGEDFVLTGDLPAGIAARWTRDGFGRPCPAPRPVPGPALGPAEGIRCGAAPEAPRLLIIGSESRLRGTYPAVLAALGDAADALGQELCLRFWDPAQAPEHALPEDIAACDGIVLPGGADMDQVGGQIRVARHAVAADIPLLGLCLGMQTTTTAVTQMRAGFNDANMEEAAPHAETKVFRRLTDSEVPGAFRVGEARMRPVTGSLLAEILGGDAPVPIRANHRYVLDPALHAPLERAGLRIAAWQGDADLADAIELPDRRFCLGLQGHPELQTRRGHPQPLFRAFLAAARG